MATHAQNAGSGLRDDLQSELEALRTDLGKVKADLRGLTDVLVEHGRSSAGEVRDRLQERMDSGVEAIQEYVEQRPVTSLLVVLGLGLIVGRLYASK